MKTLITLLRESTTPELRIGDARTTPAAIAADAARAAARLAGGDRPLLLQLRNHPADIAVLFGAAAAGRPVVLADPQASTTLIAQLERAAGQQLVRCAAASVLGEADDTLSVESLIDQGAVPTAARPAPDAFAPFLFLPTSGSTGAPKLAAHHQAALLAGAKSYVALYPLRDDATVLLPLPLVHSFGLIGGLFHALAAGHSVRLLERFTPAGFAAAAKEDALALCLGTPLVYQLLLRSRVLAGGLPSTCLALSSGGPLAPDVIEQLAEIGLLVRAIYGSTETGVIAAQAGQHLSPGTVGAAAPGVEMRLVEGELLVRTPGRFLGWANGPATANAWHRTGDRVHLDEDGTVTVLGRKSTFINVGGKKVNPTVVESVLERHPFVLEAMAVPRVVEGEQQVVALVVAASPVSDADLIAWCREALLPYEVPAVVDRVDALPRTDNGKLRRPMEETR